MIQKESAKPYIDLGGTIRSAPIESTIKKIKPLLKPLGITRVANVTGLDCVDIPVAVCIRPNSKHLSVSQGKGLTLDLAIISAVMESIEGYHAENPAPPVFQQSYCSLKADHIPVVNPYEFSSSKFLSLHLEEKSLAWATAHELQSDTPVYIPHILSNLDSTVPHPEYSLFNVNSNGLAAGNSEEEAICHAIYEIIERDSLYRWASLAEKKRAATLIKQETILCSRNQYLLEKLYTANQYVKIWNITSPLKVPAFHCVIWDKDSHRKLGVFSGSGCHLSKEIALCRALTEAAQSRLTLISGSRDDIFNDHYHKRFDFDASQNQTACVVDFADDIAHRGARHNFSANLSALKKRLWSNGYKKIYLIKHTKQQIGIPVVHAFIPGMDYNGKRI